MKRFILICLTASLFFITTLESQAQKVIAETLSSFSSDNAPYEYSVRVVQDTFFPNGKKLERDSILTGEIIKIVPPKRLKRNAYFVMTVKSYTIPSQGDEIVIIRNHHIYKTPVKTYVPMDGKDIAGKVAFTAADQVVKGFSTGVSFAKGVLSPEAGENRFQAGLRTAYEDSPISYYKKGHLVDIRAGALVKLNLHKNIMN